MLTETLRAGLYGRVSILPKKKRGTSASATTRAQHLPDDRSCRQQDEASTKACARNGWPVVARYADPGRSASRFARGAREDYERLLGDIRARNLDVVVFWESSRGGRELVAWATLLHECRARGVRIYITDHDRLYDLDIARDWKSLATDGVDAAYSSEETARRINRDIADNAAAGRPHGMVLFGYERLYDEHTRALIEQRADPASAATVAEVIRRIADGHPQNAIATGMARRKAATPNGGPWSTALVRRIATNQAYIGRRTHNGSWTKAIWPAIIDEPTFWRAQRVLASRPAGRPGAAKHLVSYLGTCNPCGSWLHVSPVRGVPYYMCKDHHCTAVRQDWLDAFITGAAGSLLDDPEFWEHLTRAGDADVLAARAKADEMRADLREHLELVKAGRLTPASFAEIESALLARIAAEDQRALSLSVAPVLRDLVRAPGGVKKLFRNSPLAVRKQVLRELFSEISLLPATRHGKHGFDPDRVVVVLREQGGGDDPDSVRVEPVE